MGRLMTLVAWSTVLALAGCARTHHAERLIADLRSADPAVRLNAAGGLRELRDPKALEPLIAALKDEDAAVRFQSAAALGELGDPLAIGPLIGALMDRDKDVRWAATFALRDLGGVSRLWQPEAEASGRAVGPHAWVPDIHSLAPSRWCDRLEIRAVVVHSARKAVSWT